MKTAWDELALSPGLALSRETIEDAFRVASAGAHPDSGGASGAFERVREARDTLLDPTQRLTQWLLLYGVETAHSGTISDEVAAMFARVGEVTDGVDAWSTKSAGMTSGLGKALAQKEGFEWKARVEALQSEVADRQAALQESFGALERAAESGDFAKALLVRSELGFLRKWQRELQVRFGKIWEGLI